MFDLQVDTRDLDRELEAAREALPEIQKAALTAGIEWLFTASKRLLTRLIYNREIPKWRNGRPKWRRKMRNGGILGSETYAVSSDGQSASIFTRPDSEPAKPITNWPGGYVQKRHESRNRPAHWRQDAKREGEPGAIRAARRVVELGLQRRR